MEAEFLNDEYRSEIIKKAKEVFEDARDFQYVRLGFEDDTFYMVTIEMKTARFPRRRRLQKHVSAEIG